MSQRGTDRYAVWVAGGCKPSPSRPAKQKRRTPGEPLPLLSRMIAAQADVCGSCGGPLTFAAAHPNLRPTFDHARAKAEPAPNWRVIAVIPADRLDGRDMLLWTVRAILCSWCDGWCDAVGRPVHGVTHWADVEGPVT